MPSSRHVEQPAANLRALRLAMDVADLMASMSAPAADVVATASDIVDAYSRRGVTIDITSNVVTMSQDRGDEHEPLTLVRLVRVRALNMSTLERCLQLAARITSHQIDLAEAERAFAQIVLNRRRWPAWVQTIAAGLVSAGVGVMFSAPWLTVALTFLVGCLADRLAVLAGRLALPPFFGQIVAATSIPLAAGALAALGRLPGAPTVAPDAIVIGALVMLLSGMLFVGSLQDAIDEFYVTAGARAIRTVMMTAGIVVGILAGLYLGKRLGLGIYVPPAGLAMGGFLPQVIGSGVVAAAYAVYTHGRPVAVAWSGAVGALAYALYLGVQRVASPLPANAAAAVAAGLLSAVVSRRLRIPATALTTAAIIGLVPGLRLYYGLIQLVNFPPGDPRFSGALATLFEALGIALAIAAGTSLGTIIGRPLKRQLQLIRNRRGRALKHWLRRRTLRRAERPAGEGPAGPVVGGARTQHSPARGGAAG